MRRKPTKKGRFSGGGLASSSMIKSAKNVEREKRVDADGIAFSWGIFLIYRQRFAESPSYFEKESHIFRDKSVFHYQRLILLYQRLSFPYPRLFLRGVRDSEVGTFANNIVFVGFLLLGVCL